MKGRLHTRYAPVRRSLVPKNYTPRLACVKPAASVHPEPGSNSSSYIMRLLLSYLFLTEDLSVHSLISRFHYSYSFALTSLLKRLSIQYVYERVYLFFRPVHHLAWLSKRVQNYNFFFNTTRKIWSFFWENFHTSNSFILVNTSMNFACLAGCKTNTFTLFSQALFDIFFKEILSPLSVMLASVSVNVCVVAGAKVVSLYR